MTGDRFIIVHREKIGLMSTALVLVDRETGVNYMYVQSGYSGGLTPVLDAEGKPVVTNPYAIGNESMKGRY